MHVRLALLLSATLFLGSCAAPLPELPAGPLGPATVETAVPETGRFALCEVTPGTRRCGSPSRGLGARGLGGLLLPLDARVDAVTFRGERASVDLAVNGIGAWCSSGIRTLDTPVGAVAIRRLLCNWIGIGNVVASLHLAIDWRDGAERLGGRYAIRFNGTGNGSGTGHFVAERVR